MLISSEGCKKQWDASGSEEQWLEDNNSWRGFFKWEKISSSGKGFLQVKEQLQFYRT